MSEKTKIVNQRQIKSDYEWVLLQNLSQYKGQWIAISKHDIIARDASLKKVKEAVSTLNLENIPLYIQVPSEAIIA